MEEIGQRVLMVPEGLGEAVLASASDAIVATDREGIITFWNPGRGTHFRICGVRSCRTLARFDRPGQSQTTPLGWLPSRHGNWRKPVWPRRLLSVPALTKNGSRVSVEFTIVMLRDDRGRPTGTAAILRHVTKRFEETRQLKRELAQSLQASRGPTP